MEPIGTDAPPRSKAPKRPPGYNEEVDEAPGQLDDQPVDVEENHPADQRDSVERAPEESEKQPPLYED